MTIRYDEIKVNDIIKFHGANVRVLAIKEFPYTEQYYAGQTDKAIYFTIEPADAEALEILGNFYGHGEYGGVGCLEIELVERKPARMTYGYSMYGGWYANNADMTINLKTETLKELRNICKANGYALACRRDNI